LTHIKGRYFERKTDAEEDAKGSAAEKLDAGVGSRSGVLPLAVEADISTTL